MGITKNRDEQSSRGFTIVELLVVIVVVAILATITVVSYSGVQQRARDSQREQDIKTIVQALELYRIKNGRYPAGKCTGTCVINGGWSNTNDGSWANLEAALVPTYLASMPVDPKVSTGNPLSASQYGYAYFASTSYLYCGAPVGQMFILVYTLESSDQKDKLKGPCVTNKLGPYANKSNYRQAIGGS